MAVGHANGNIGTDFRPGGIVGKQDWNYSGGITKAQSSSPDRFSGVSPATAGLSFFRNRAYDARTGRWTQEDPIGAAGGVNLYQFNGNDPVTYTDPFGLCLPWPQCALAAAAAGARTGTVVGAAVGTIVEPGGGTVAGAGIGRLVGGVGGFALATAGTIYLTVQAHQIGKTEAQLGVALEHIEQIENFGSDDNDPEGKKRDWTKHAQKALNNARKYVQKIKGKTGEALKQSIDELSERLTQSQGQ